MSEIRPKFMGSVDEAGRLILNPVMRANLNKWLLTLRNSRVEVSIGKPQKARTNAENRYYFGVVVKLLADHLGYSTEDMHELLKIQFNSKIVDIGTKKYRIPQSTSNLKVPVFEEYLEKIRIWAAEYLGVVIPLPGEVDLDIE